VERGCGGVGAGREGGDPAGDPSVREPGCATGVDDGWDGDCAAGRDARGVAGDCGQGVARVWRSHADEEPGVDAECDPVAELGGVGWVGAGGLPAGQAGWGSGLPGFRGWGDPAHGQGPAGGSDQLLIDASARFGNVVQSTVNSAASGQSIGQMGWGCGSKGPCSRGSGEEKRVGKESRTT